jgi:hypothetical protein
LENGVFSRGLRVFDGGNFVPWVAEKLPGFWGIEGGFLDGVV